MSLEGKVEPDAFLGERLVGEHQDALTSIAISLKRIADALEAKNEPLIIESLYDGPTIGRMVP